MVYGVAIPAVIVGVGFDVLRDPFWERLTADLGIVLVFGVFYLRFLMRP